MKTHKPGKRHPLLLYRRSLDRLWKPTLVLGLILATAWGWALFSGESLFTHSNDSWLFLGAAASLAFSGFAFLARYLAYVQVCSDHINVVTPFLRLKVSYRRVRTIHPSAFQQLFPKKEGGWAQRSYLEPFYTKTAVVAELKNFPMSKRMLKLFLPAQMFSPQTTGLIFVVPDWMTFSTELDSMQGAWLQGQNRRTSVSTNFRYQEAAKR